MAKKKMAKWERERSQAKARAREKGKLVQRAADVVEQLWKASLERDSDSGKSVFTAAEREAIADASYSLRGISGGWINDRRR